MIKTLKNILIDSGIEPNEAKIEVELALESIAKLSTKDLLLGKLPTDEDLSLIEKLIKERAITKKPIQYLLGEAYFMGEKFLVDENVLIPRDETELLVRKSIEIIKNNNFNLGLDMCSGSGCIACMVAKLSTCQMMGVDISSEALHIAFKNMEKLELFNKAVFRKSNLFDKIRPDEKFDIIISNPPYVPPSEKTKIQTEVSFEPDLALYTSDKEGLEFYEKITKIAPKFLNKGGYLLFELGIGQVSSVKSMMENSSFYEIELIKDLAGIDRVICGRI